MTVGGEVNKNQRINAFIAGVINPAINRIQRDKGDMGIASGMPSPIVNRSDLNVTPGSFEFNGTNPSAVDTAGGMLTAAALADLFISYAHKLSAIRRSNLVHQLIQTDISCNLTYGVTNVWTNQVTALSQEYALSPIEFKNRVIAGGNPLASLQPGQVAAVSALNNLISRLNAVLNTRAGESIGTLTVYSCHGSCHSSCHGSRGRR